MNFTQTTKTIKDWVHEIKNGVTVRLPIEDANELIKYIIEFESDLIYKIKRYSNKITFSI